jgi:hypothetical protein
MWITKKEYEEHGNYILIKKCCLKLNFIHLWSKLKFKITQHKKEKRGEIF